MVMSTWIYVFDEFKPIDIDSSKLFKLVEENPLELFEIVREKLVDDVKEIRTVRDVKVYNTYFDPSNLELLIEYLVECNEGEISIKVIHSHNPPATLRKYYEYEKG